MGYLFPSTCDLLYEAARESPQESSSGADDRAPLEWCAREWWEEGMWVGHPQPLLKVDLSRCTCLRTPPSSHSWLDQGCTWPRKRQCWWDEKMGFSGNVSKRQRRFGVALDISLPGGWQLAWGLRGDWRLRVGGIWADRGALLRMSVCGGKQADGGEINRRGLGRAKSPGDLGESAALNPQLVVWVYVWLGWLYFLSLEAVRLHGVPWCISPLPKLPWKCFCSL